MLELDATSLIIILIVSLLAGAVKVAFGVGAGALATVIMAMVLPPKMAVGLLAPIMIITDIQALRYHWRKWDTKQVMVILPTAVLGIGVGTAFLGWAPPGVVRKAIGTVAILFALLQLLRMYQRDQAPVALPLWSGWIIGFFAGITTTVAHAGGVVFSMYLLGANLPKNTFVATVVALFFATNTIKLPLYWSVGVLTLPILLMGILLTPVMVAGGWLGSQLSRRISVQQFLWIVTLLVGASGLLLLLT